MEERPNSYRRSFAKVITTVVITLILLTLLASRDYSTGGPIRIEQLPNPRSHQLRVDDTIRLGSSTTASLRLTGGQSAANVTLSSTTAIGEKYPANVKKDQPSANITKRTKKYYRGLTCPRDNPRPGKNLPKIAIVSFPRAGNGWTRQLIQYATGLYAGSYGWQTLKKRHPNTSAFPATGDDVDNGRVVIIKTHGGPTPELSNEVVLLIRNPYKSFVSDVYKRVFLRRKYSRKEMLDFFKSDGWVNEVTEMMESWTSTATHWIAESKRTLVVSNERLFENTEFELTRILDFIHHPTSKKKIQCAVKTYYPVASAARFNVDPYTDELKMMMDSSIAKVNRTLKDNNLSTLPTYPPISYY